jgi:hypothetical protein
MATADWRKRIKLVNFIFVLLSVVAFALICWFASDLWMPQAGDDATPDFSESIRANYPMSGNLTFDYGQYIDTNNQGELTNSPPQPPAGK